MYFPERLHHWFHDLSENQKLLNEFSPRPQVQASILSNFEQNCASFIFGSCYLDRAYNVEIGVECQIFVILTFFNCSQVLQFEAHSRYHISANIFHP